MEIERLSDSERNDEQAFPKLSDEQINSIRAFGKEVELPAETCLFKRGDKNTDFFVVLRGAIGIFSTNCHGGKQLLVTHEPRSFTGELSFFNNQKIFADGYTSTPSRLLRVHWRDFRRMLMVESDLATLILRAFIRRRLALIDHSIFGVFLIGPAELPDTLRIHQFLIRVGFPHTWVRPEDKGDDGRPILEILSLQLSDLPVVRVSEGRLLKNPSLTELASELGFLEEFTEERTFDVAVVGAGPAGLAAAVGAASEGLDTIVFEAGAPGGQAGTSSRIENYLGFPHGISGQELASLAQIQAEKFGARFAVATPVAVVRRNKNQEFEITLSDGKIVRSRTMIVASGATYRKLDVPGYQRFEGRGIHYAATPMEAQLCKGEEVVVVGGGNSAGQAAVYLSQTVTKVHMLVRSRSLSSTMSNYLIQRIQASPKIQVYYETEVTTLSGQRILEQVEWTCTSTRQCSKKPVRTLFVMIGANPNTDWLKGCITLNEKGFVVTGKTKAGNPYETEEPGLFAVGDVRADSVKRVASAVGEGAVVISWIHPYLAEFRAKREGESRAA